MEELMEILIFISYLCNDQLISSASSQAGVAAAAG